MEQGGEAELIAQMKSSVQTLGSSAQDYRNMTLLRFLIARSMDPGKAAKMFVQWQKWRADIAPLGFIPDSEVPDELNGRKVYLGGPTKDGHPLVIMKLCKHFPSKDQLQFKSKYWSSCISALVALLLVRLQCKFKAVCLFPVMRMNNSKYFEFVVHLLDKSFASAHKGIEVGNEKLIGIIDLQQISYRNVDTRGMITGFQFLQAYYPERLARCFILHMPRFFVSIWKIISRFLEKETQQKITIVSNEDEMRSFVEQIGEDALPECYGGKAKLVVIQDVVVTPTS